MWKPPFRIVEIFVLAFIFNEEIYKAELKCMLGPLPAPFIELLTTV